MDRLSKCQNVRQHLVRSLHKQKALVFGHCTMYGAR